MNSQDKKEKISTRRTYLLLSRSLFALLEETPFEKLTLTQLCDHCLVPRSTFYRYFEDKYDLLYYCLQTFFDSVRLDRDVIYLKEGKGHKFIAKLIHVLEENRTSFQKIYRTNRNGVFMDILRNYLMQIFEQTVDELTQEGWKLKISRPVFTYLLADLYISMAQCYLSLEHGCSPETFAEDVRLFAQREFFN